MKRPFLTFSLRGQWDYLSQKKQEHTQRSTWCCGRGSWGSWRTCVRCRCSCCCGCGGSCSTEGAAVGCTVFWRSLTVDFEARAKAACEMELCVCVRVSGMYARQVNCITLVRTTQGSPNIPQKIRYWNLTCLEKHVWNASLGHGRCKTSQKTCHSPQKIRKLRTATQIIQSARLAVRSPKVLIKSRKRLKNEKKKRNDEKANTHK